MGDGIKSLTQVRSEREKETSADWEQREVVFAFEDGWTIERLYTTKDRKIESDLVHRGAACITGREWDKRLDSREYVLLSLRDADGIPKATLLFGEANFVVKSRAGTDYTAYTGCRAFDQQPRCLDGVPLVALQCCPTGYMAGDTSETKDETKRVKSWYEALPLAADFDGWRCNDADLRVAAQEFLRKEQDGKTPAESPCASR